MPQHRRLNGSVKQGVQDSEGTGERATASMSKLIHPEFTTVDGLSIRFAEGGNAGQDAISLGPWPERVYAFEQVWTRLAFRRDPGGLHVVLRGRSFRRHDPLRPGLPRAAADAARSVARHQNSGPRRPGKR